MLEFFDEYGDLLIEIKEGDEFKINVIIWGNLSLNVEWFKDDKLFKRISCGNILVWGNKFGIIIFIVIFEDFGVYKCVVKSVVGIMIKIF